MNKAYWAVCGSLLLHFLLYMGVGLIPPQAVPLRETIEFELQEKKNLSAINAPILRETQIPEELKKPIDNSPATALSNETVRVRKETKAALLGLTKNRFTPSPEKRSTKSQSAHSKDIDPELEGGKKIANQNGQDAPDPILDSLRYQRELSAIGQEITKPAEIGSFTALNTDRYMFYSFFSRIEDLIRYEWESSVRATMNSTNPASIRNPRPVWTTLLEVSLDSSGNLKSIQLLKPSGIAGFDQAAVFSFKKAQRFPNPPKELINEEGTIVLKYGFNVHYSPSLMGRR